MSQLTPAEGRLDLLGLLPLMPLMVRSPGRLSPDEELRYRYWRGIWIDHGFPGVVHDGSSSHVAARGAALLRRLELREDLGLQEPEPTARARCRQPVVLTANHGKRSASAQMVTGV